MVITFPHMGKAYISIKALLDELGVKMVMPPPISKKTLETGTRLSPEMACLPLKINIGNYIESIKQGADTIIITGSCGPCRFGYYGVVQKEILNDLGYHADVLILDPPNGNWKAFLERIQRVAGGQPWRRVAKAFVLASRVVEAVDELLELSLKKRCREQDRGSTDWLLQRFERELREVHGAHSILQLIKHYADLMDNVAERKNIRPLKIGIVGEIYTIIEPYVNMEVEKKLGSMGAEVYRGITVNSWVKDHLSFNIKRKRENRRILKKAKPYLDLCIGGHAWQTIANAVHYADIGLDGVIQILPFGCMPEIVAESILPRVAEEKNIPIMTLTVDEMTGEAGCRTRLEAFTDLLEQKRGIGHEK